MLKNRVITVTLNPCIDKTLELADFCEGGLNRVQNLRRDAGGKGINVAKVVKNFGTDVLCMGFLGAEGGSAVTDELERRQIAHSFLILPGETRTNYKLFNQTKAEITEVNEPGFSVTAKDAEALLAALEKALPEAGVLVLSGSAAPGTPPELYGRILSLAAGQGVKTILDADGERLSAGLGARPTVIKPNLFELEQLCGEKISSERELLSCGRWVLDRGIELLVVSMGAEGAVFLTGNEALRVRAAKIRCQSTVGAGDSMVAALACGLLRGTALPELARMASTAGSITASKPGTEVCTEEEVLQCMEQLTAEKLR